MATTQLNSLIMQFRRIYGDMQNRTTGNEIADASEDGEDFKSTEATDLAVQGINELLALAYKSAEYKAEILSRLFPEYLFRVTLSGTAGGGNVLTADLPSDFGWVVSARFREGGTGDERIRIASSVVTDAAVAGLSNELNVSPVGHIENTKFYLVYNRAVSLDPIVDQIFLTYVAKQPTTTVVVGAGGTDVLIDSKWDGQVTRLMFQKARQFKQ